VVGVALESGGSSELEPRLDNKRTICMKRLRCNHVQGSLADGRVAKQQEGKLAYKKP
jgi:hypothetical protein